MDLIFLGYEDTIDHLSFTLPAILNLALDPFLGFLCGPNAMVFSSLSCSSLLLSFPYLHPMFGFTVVSLFLAALHHLFLYNVAIHCCVSPVTLYTLLHVTMA